MNYTFPPGVPEIPVSNIDQATAYYKDHLGFSIDWVSGGIAGISRGSCRMFMTDTEFRQSNRNAAPVVVWLNLSSKDEVNDLHDRWQRSEAKIVSPPESKPFGLHEFTAVDLDGNMFRVFYDFGTQVERPE